MLLLFWPPELESTPAAIGGQQQRIYLPIYHPRKTKKLVRKIKKARKLLEPTVDSQTPTQQALRKVAQSFSDPVETQDLSNQVLILKEQLQLLENQQQEALLQAANEMLQVIQELQLVLAKQHEEEDDLLLTYLM